MLRNVKTYMRPRTVEDAVALVHSHANATYIGGGAWVAAQGDPTLEMVVDLRDLGLNTIEGTLERVVIGATVTLQEIIDHPDAGTIAGGVLAEAAGITQSRTLREQGTLGGTLMVAGPEDPLTTVLLGLDAEVQYADPVVHTAPFLSFVAYRDRLLKTRALITQVRVPRAPLRSATQFEEVGRTPKDRPVVCVAAYLAVEEGLPATVRLAVGGAHARPTRLPKAEHLLRGQLLTREKIERALAPALVELEPVTDFRGSAEYRLAMGQGLAVRALLAAWERARRS